MKCLIADDSEIIRNVLIKVIRMLGYPIKHFKEASNGQEALAALDEEIPELIVTDLKMPIMSGVELINKIKQSSDYSNIPLVVVSSEASDYVASELKDYPELVHLRKPFSPLSIKNAIDKVLKPQSTQHVSVHCMGDAFEELLAQFEYTAYERYVGDIDDVAEECSVIKLFTDNGVNSYMVCNSKAPTFLAELIDVDYADTSNIRQSAMLEFANLIQAYCQDRLKQNDPIEQSMPEFVKEFELSDFSDKGISFSLNSDATIFFCKDA